VSQRPGSVEGKSLFTRTRIDGPQAPEELRRAGKNPDYTPNGGPRRREITFGLFQFPAVPGASQGDDASFVRDWKKNGAPRIASLVRKEKKRRYESGE